MTGRHTGREYDLYMSFQADGRIEQWGLREINPRANKTAVTEDNPPQIMDYEEQEW